MFTRRPRVSHLPCLLAPLAAAAAIAIPATSTDAAPVAFNGHEYEVVLDAGVTRADAAAAASASGGHLASITSADEQDFLEDVLYHFNLPTGGYWMGLERIGTDGQGLADDFRWDTGEALTYENFAAGEPNEYLNMEDSAQVYWSADLVDDVNTRRGGWNDVPRAGYAESPVTDLVTVGYIIERAQVGEDTPPVAIPLPPAVVAAPAAMALAGLAVRRRRRATI